MGIIIGADIVPIEKNMMFFEKAQTTELVGGELEDILNHADFRIFNLEVPLVDELNPIPKMGPNLAAPTASVAGLKALGADLFTLANNHIMDHGVKGLMSTFSTLEKAGISYVGAGENIEAAKRPFIVTVKGKKYGIYACAEHEFSIAGKEMPGANPFDPLESLDHISNLKGMCDYVIVLYHGGKEYYRYPSPNLQKVCRKIIEKGADLVVCQHSHCIGCRESYLSGTIVYGQGNFLFPKYDNDYWNTALAIKLEEDGHLDFIPIIKEGAGVRLAPHKDAERILEDFERRSKEIESAEFVESKYKEFAEQNITDYLFYFSGIDESNIFYRILNRLMGRKLNKIIADRNKRRCKLGIRNFVECEAHRELLLKGLEDHV